MTRAMDAKPCHFRKTSRRLWEIRHAIPGRIRFRVRPMRGDQDLARTLEERMKALEGVIWSRTNLGCGSLIVGYRPETRMEERLEAVLESPFLPPASLDACRVCSDADRPADSRRALRRFIGLGGIAGAAAAAERVMGVAVAQTLWSPLGVISLVAALPLVFRGVRDARSGRWSLETFLGGAIVAATAAGQALAALEILWITAGGEWMTAWITERSRRAIRDILEVTAKNTYVLVDGVEVEVAVSEVKPGDRVAVHTGEKISVDGRVVDGEAILDEAPINGRSELSPKGPGDLVYAGTFVREGVLHVRAERVGDRTYLSRILGMVEESMENKAPIEGAAEELARRLIRVGFVSTLGTLALTASPWRAFTVMLVMACPCATVLAASTAVAAAMSAAARRHILIKGGRYLEEVGRVDVVCFDKTGTLTTNQPALREIVPAPGAEETEILQLAGSAERHNSHPLARAIQDECERRRMDPVPHDVCEYFLGKGVRSEIQGAEVLIGNAKLMRKFEVSLSPVQADHERMYHRGLTTVFVAREGRVVGVMGFANQTRPAAAEVVRHFQDEGMDIALITGDEECTALSLTDDLGISECFYSVLPEEKSDIVRNLKADGRKTLMVGDGINDALALAEADVGIAMGAGGSEVAIEAADIALVKDELSGVVYVRSLSRATLKVVRQNFWIATGTNLAGVALGAAGLLSPVLAGLFHVIHTAGILANSSRLLAHEPSPVVSQRPKTERRSAGDSPAPAENRVVAFPRPGKTG